jgi:hypothetical protein
MNQNHNIISEIPKIQIKSRNPKTKSKNYRGGGSLWRPWR